MRRARSFSVLVGVVVTLAILAASAPTVVAQSAEDADPLTRDAGQYASAMGVDASEAMRRLKLQVHIGDLNARLTKNEPDSFGGLWVQHQPEYRVFALFTRGGEAKIQEYTAGGPLSGMVGTRTAKVTLTELVDARTQAARMAGRLGIAAHSAINILEGNAELYVLDAAHLDAALQKAAARLPDHVKVVQVPAFPKEATDIFGGLGLAGPSGSCTSGFSVQDSSGNKGITTAGHCDNTGVTYMGSGLPFVSESWVDAFDIQWHTAPGFTVRNLIWDGTYNRYIYGVVFGISQYPGDWVCKYGIASGYGCGSIVTTSFDGFNVEVDISVAGGDSGGPWFWNNSAFGSTISQYGSHSIYGPVDTVYSRLGVSVSTE